MYNSCKNRDDSTQITPHNPDHELASSDVFLIIKVNISKNGNSLLSPFVIIFSISSDVYAVLVCKISLITIFVNLQIMH